MGEKCAAREKCVRGVRTRSEQRARVTQTWLSARSASGRKRTLELDVPGFGRLPTSTCALSMLQPGMRLHHSCYHDSDLGFHSFTETYRRASYCRQIVRERLAPGPCIRESNDDQSQSERRFRGESERPSNKRPEPGTCSAAACRIKGIITLRGRPRSSGRHVRR